MAVLQMFRGSASLLYFLCFNVSGEVSGESPARSGEVLQMLNGGATNVLWFCYFTIIFVLQCLRRVSGEVPGELRRVSGEVSGKLRRGLR